MENSNLFLKEGLPENVIVAKMRGWEPRSHDPGCGGAARASAGPGRRAVPPSHLHKELRAPCGPELHSGSQWSQLEVWALRNPIHFVVSRGRKFWVPGREKQLTATSLPLPARGLGAPQPPRPPLHPLAQASPRPPALPSAAPRATLPAPSRGPAGRLCIRFPARARNYLGPRRRPTLPLAPSADHTESGVQMRGNFPWILTQECIDISSLGHDDDPNPNLKGF